MHTIYTYNKLIINLNKIGEIYTYLIGIYCQLVNKKYKKNNN